MISQVSSVFFFCYFLGAFYRPHESTVSRRHTSFGKVIWCESLLKWWLGVVNPYGRSERKACQYQIPPQMIPISSFDIPLKSGLTFVCNIQFHRANYNTSICRYATKETKKKNNNTDRSSCLPYRQTWIMPMMVQ